MVTPTDASTPSPVQIQILDQCEPASFNAVLGPGACVGTGTVTFAQFLGELTSLQRAPQWRFTPAQLQMQVGQKFVATNMGGETHTFTEVKLFGGGIVPLLNQLSGAKRLAPECTNDMSSPYPTPLACSYPPKGSWTALFRPVRLAYRQARSATRKAKTTLVVP
jgi:hypothetical protein